MQQSCRLLHMHMGEIQCAVCTFIKVSHPHLFQENLQLASSFLALDFFWRVAWLRLLCHGALTNGRSVRRKKMCL